MLSAAGGAGAMAFGMTMVLTDHFTNIADNISRRLILLDSQVDRYNSRVSSNMQRSVNTIQSGIAQTFYGAALMLPFGAAIEKAGEYQMSLIRLKNLFGDTAKAQMALAKIEQDALLFPALGTQDLLKVSANILQVNGDFKQVNETVNDLALALMQSGQTSGMVFERMGLNLQQLFTYGNLEWKELKQFSTAGLPMMKVFDQMGVKYGDGIKVSVEDTLKALKIMAGDRKILDEIANSAAGAGASLKELAEMTLVKFGLAIEKEFVKFAKLLGVLLTDLRTFFESNIGKFVAKMLVLTTAFISLGLVLLGVWRIWKGFKNLFISGFTQIFKNKSLGLVLKQLGRFTLLLWASPKLIESNSIALQGLALTIAYLSGGMAWVVLIFSAASRAWNDFSKFLNDGVKPATAVGRAFVWLGGIMQGLIDFFNTWDGETFSFSYKMDKALRDSGAMKYLLGIIWIIKSIGWAIEGIVYWLNVIAENKGLLSFLVHFYLIYKVIVNIGKSLGLVFSTLLGKNVIASSAALRGLRWALSALFDIALAKGWMRMAQFLLWFDSIFAAGWIAGFRAMGVAAISGITSVAASLWASMIPAIQALWFAMITGGVRFAISIAPLWLLAIIIILALVIIGGLCYLIYTYWEQIVDVIKIVGKIIWEVILAPFKAFIALFEYLLGIKNTGNFGSLHMPDDGQQLEYSAPDAGLEGSTSMNNFIETKYGSNRRGNTSDYGGGNNQSMSYGGERTIILQLDGKEIYRTMEDYKRFENARGEA